MLGAVARTMSATRSLLGSIGLFLLVACGGEGESAAPPLADPVAPAPTTETPANGPPPAPPPAVATDFTLADSAAPLVLRAKTPLSRSFRPA